MLTIWVNYFFGVLEDQADFLNNFVTFQVSFSVFLGMIHITRLHSRIVLRRETRWPFSILLLGSFFLMVIIGLIPPIGTNESYNWLYANVYRTGNIALGAVVPFYFASAMYRAFRVRSLESLLLVFGAVMMLLRTIPLGPYLLPGIDVMADWFMQVPVVGVSRALLMGIGIGFLALSIRTVLGRERGFFGVEREQVAGAD
jgi:hypothetical protein